MTLDEYAAMIANQPGVTDGLLWPGPVPPPVTYRDTGPREGVSGPDNEPGLDDSQIYAEFLKPDGTTAWLQKDNREVYERKGFVLTGAEFNVEVYNDQVQQLDRWRAVGEHPGENRSLWPPPGV